MARGLNMVRECKPAASNYDTASTSYITYQYFNGLGQPTRSIGQRNTATTARAIADVEYDILGRPYHRSNPFYGVGRTSPLGSLWTTSTYDDLGRMTSVTAPDGSTAVQMNYDGSTTNGVVQTVTDQAGKQRRSITDAIGRLLEAQEPDASGNLGTLTAPTQKTNYDYDILGNVVKTTQISPLTEIQNRYFKYDGLSRLTHERQVEQAAPHPETDALTGNNNWSKVITVSGEPVRGTVFSFNQEKPL